ncbi:MAG: hypothetical protein E7507_05085 [Ruminococcus sp.]|nr:hypothetical protein [Ruminococcus sp.]
MARKKRVTSLTVLEIAIIVVCALMIIVMLSCYFMFRKDGSAPEVFGKTVYVTTATNMEPNIPAGAAVFASDENMAGIAAGDVVLFRLMNNADGTSVTGILRVQKIEYDESGMLYYTLKGDASAATESIRIPQTSIIAKCVSYDRTIGAVIRFTTSTMGLLVVVIIPCLLLIVFQIVRIIRIRSEEDDDDDYDYDYDDDDEEDEDDEDEDDEEEIFVPRKAQPKKQPVYEEPARRPAPAEAEAAVAAYRSNGEAVRRQAYVGGDGTARYTSNQTPTATTEEFRRAIRREQPLERQYENEIPSFRHRPQEVNNSYKPNSYRTGEYVSEGARTERIKSIDDLYEPRKSTPVETAVEVEEEPKLYYTPKPKEELAPRAVENPVDVTIPTAAKIPEETIAPPPKKNNNKTVEELMRMIDNAQ